jgi:cell division septation protein DedD
MQSPPHSVPFRALSSPLSFGLTAAALLSLPMLLTGCKHVSAGTKIAVASPQAIESAREQMDLIPPPSKTRYMAVHTLESWQNPYLTVQENMATLHVTMADANPSEVGVGGLLRPVAARRQDLTIRVSDLPAALNAVPENSWPYGRVVAIEEAHDAPATARPAIRRNVEATIKTLSDLGVVVYEWNDNGGGLR